MTQNAAPTTAQGAPGAARVAVTTAVSFDAAIGADASALNATIAAAFPTVHPLIFPRTFDAKVGTKDVSVAIDIFTAPTIAIKPTAAFQAEAKAAVSKSGLTQADAESTVAGMLKGSLTVSCTDVQAVVTYAGQPSVKVNASMEIGAAVSVTQTGTDSATTITLVQASVTVPNEPELTALLTDVAAPLLLDYLNNHVLSAPIPLPSLNLKGVQLAAPVISEEQPTAGGDDFLIAYTGLEPVVPPAGGTAWPTGTLFAAIDAAAIQAVAAELVPTLPADTWWGPSGWWGSVSAGYNVTLSNPSVQVPPPGAGDQVNVSFDLSAEADFTWHTPDSLPNTPFGGSVTGSVSVGGKVTARPNGQNQDIYVAFDQASTHDLIAHVFLPGGFPLPIGDFDPLADLVGAAATAVLQNFAFKLYTIPAITLPVPGNYALVPQNLALRSIAGPGGLPMEAVTLGLTVVKKA